MYSIIVYIPTSHLEIVKQAMFTHGAGQLGNYSCCCWQVRGLGQFYANENSNAFIGFPQTLTQVDEYRVEMICDTENLSAVLAAMKEAHPYEEPAFMVLNLVT